MKTEERKRSETTFALILLEGNLIEILKSVPVDKKTRGMLKEVKKLVNQRQDELRAEREGGNQAWYPPGALRGRDTLRAGISLSTPGKSKTLS